MTALAAGARPRATVVTAAGSTTRAGARLLAFGALGAFATAHWTILVADPPVAGLAAGGVVALALAVALIVLGRSGLARTRLHSTALGLTLASGVLALLAAGLPAALLEPARWDDLAGELDRGLSGIRTVTWPYDGTEEWVRLVIVLAAPATLVTCAALAFWPARRGGVGLRTASLLGLLLLYGTAVTEHDPGEPLLRGPLLLGLVAAWLWAPRLRGREAAYGAALVVAAAVISLPLAARLDADGALIDYRAWNWFVGEDVTFDWNHSYGPLDWPREGTTLLNVRAGRPHYWKAQTLDRFDGVRWLRSDAADGARSLELPTRRHPRWRDRIRVTVRSLQTDFVVAAGTPYLITGVGDAVIGSADGTVRRLDEPLRRGDSYTVRTYDPHPSAGRMRAASDAYGAELAHYTNISLPGRGLGARGRTRSAGGLELRGRIVSVPLYGGGLGTPGAERRLAASPYGAAFRLARRLAASAPTAYDAVSRIERHLERRYLYGERPPDRRYPLAAFLFRDRIGYCQQFSGAMALMLRMLGIPSRVVSGFAPGSLNRDTGEYRVRDLDAHSWVEVFFTGIGWVTFDPTPPPAPATRPDREARAQNARDEAAGNASSDSGGTAGGDRAGEVSRRGGEKGAGGGIPASVIGLVLAGLAACVTVVALLRRGRATATDAAEASLRELERALQRLGWELRPRTTLLELERRLRRAAGPRAAGYVWKLRAGRFGAQSPGPPTAADRRALRRELTAAGGIATRLRGFLALPPGRPFSHS